MRGFAVGSLTLIVLYVLLQQGSAQKVTTANNVLANGFRRMLSGDVAAIPNKHGTKASLYTKKPASTTTNNSSTTIYV